MAVGSAKERLDALRRPADVYIINRENVVWLITLLRAKKIRGWDMLVIDELSSFKSPQAKRFRALRPVMPIFDRVVGLTGTPSPNGLLDLWSQVYLLDGGERLGKTVTGYRERYFNPGMRNGYTVFNWIPKPEAQKAIEKKLSDLCISMSAEDYLKMPEKIVRDVPVYLSKEEMGLYRTMEREQVLTLEDKELTAFSAAAVWGKLLQLANGAAYDAEQNYVEFHDRKMEALEEIIDTAAGHPVLVFYNYQHDRSRIQARIRAKTLDGPEDIAAWNCGEIPVLLAQPASMGHGLNLQAGGHIIVWFGLNPSLELYQQANARLYRQGQQSAVIIHRLVAKGTVDEDVIKKLENKEAGQESLLEALKARLEEYRRNDR